MKNKENLLEMSVSSINDSIFEMYKELPHFSNAENRKLHASLEKGIKEVEKLSHESSDLSERVSLLKQHLNNVRSEINSKQKLVLAKEEQLKQEESLKQVVFNELSNVKKHRTEVEAETGKLRSMINDIHVKMFVAQNRVYEFKEESEENERQLAMFTEIASQKLDDLKTIQKYQDQDDKLTKKLIDRREKYNVELANKKAELDKEVLTTKALQVELDSNASAFMQLHDERNSILSNWEDTLNRIKSLEAMIVEKTGLFEIGKKEAEQLSISIADGKKSLEMFSKENEDKEKQISMKEHLIGKLNVELDENNKLLSDYKNSLEDSRAKLAAMENNEKFYEQEIIMMEKQIEKDYARKEEFQRRLEQTEKAYQVQLSESGDFESYVKELDEALLRYNKQIESLEKQTVDENKQKFVLGRETQEIRQKLEGLQSELRGSKARSSILSEKIRKLDIELFRQDQISYTSKYKMQGLQRKINAISVGEETGEEREKLLDYINNLESKIEAQKSELKILENQNSRLKLEYKLSSKRKITLSELNQKIKSDLEAIELDIKNSERFQNEARKKKESTIVQLNMLRVQNSKLMEHLELHADEQISLENRKQQLALSLRERMTEIDIHINELKIQLKNEEDAKHKAMLEISERNKYLNSLEAKFNIASRPNVGTDGQQLTQAEKLVQHMKEKQEISKQGEYYQQEIVKAMTEIKALERAATKLDIFNGEFKNELLSPRPSTEEKKQIALLNETINRLRNILDGKVSEVKNASYQKKALQKSYDEIQKSIDKTQSEIDIITNSKEKIEKEIADMNEKMKRANYMLQVEIKKRRENDGISPNASYPFSPSEKDVEIKLSTWFLENIADQLVTFAESNKEIEPQVRLAISQLGIKFKPKIPLLKLQMPKPPSNSSGSANSTRSGASFRSKKSSGSYNSTQSARSNISVKILEFGIP